jgi:signal transduction histidine kinase
LTPARTGAPADRAAGGAEAGGAGDRLAGLWLACYERLAAAATHEVNNALNGVGMNLEVVRLRATPGGDAGRVAAFATAGAEEHESVVALVGALLALGRLPRGSGAPDVAEVVRHAAAVHGSLLRHRGATVAVEPGDRAAPTGAPARAVRLAVCAAFEAASAALPGPHAAGDPAAVLRCNLQVTDGPTLAVTPAPAAWPPDVAAALADAGVQSTMAPDALRLAFVAA